MIVNAIKTERVMPGMQSLTGVLDRHVKKLPDGSILAITSKIVSICEGRTIPEDAIEKLDLVKEQSQYYLEPDNAYNISLTIADNTLIPAAGIDQSNSSGHYVLWPKNAQKTVNEVRVYLSKKFKLKKFGVIITDSVTWPLRYGTTGFAIAHSGFAALKDYIGTPDIFGRKLEVTKSNLINELAAAAVLLMGEGSEQTPLALIEDVPFIQFQPRNPTPAELRGLKISMRKDLYAPLLKHAPWKKGRS